MSMSNYLESGVLNHILRTTSFSQPSTVAVALTTNIPSDAETGATISELSGGSYARVDLGAPSDADWDAIDQGGPGPSGHTSNTSEVAFPTATAAWGHVSGVALLDSASTGAGNVLFWGKVDPARDVQNNDVFKFNSNDLDIYLN